jgi:hypothetical protein
LDSAKDTADRTRDAMAPYAATARKAALQYADEARNRLGPTVEAIGPKAAALGVQARIGASHTAQAARVQYAKHVAPQLEQAFAALPPHAQETTLKAVHRAQEAALSAKHSAERAAEATRTTVGPRFGEAVAGAKAAVVPTAQEAQVRGAAALTALQGHVTAAEISEIAAKNIKKENRNGWATGLAVAGTVAIGAGVFAWQWWRRQNNPEWLVEPPMPADTAPGGAGGTAPQGGGATASTTPVNGSTPRDPDGPATTASTPDATASTPDTDRPKPHDPRKPH